MVCVCVCVCSTRIIFIFFLANNNLIKTHKYTHTQPDIYIHRKYVKEKSAKGQEVKAMVIINVGHIIINDEEW